MPSITVRGQHKNPLRFSWGRIQITGAAAAGHIEEVVLGTSLGCENFGDGDWIGCFNIRAIGEGGVAISSNWGITSQSTSCFYLMHPILRTDFVDFIMMGRA